MNTPRKKILYVITKSNFGGAQRYVFELATSLPKDRYDIAVACGGNGVLADKLRAAGIHIFEIKSFQRDINFKKEIQAFFELLKVIKTFTPDIVHLNSSKAGGIGSLASRILGVKKIIFTAHGWAFWENRSPLWRSLVWFFSWLTALFSHHIIVVSSFEYDRTHLPFTKHKFQVIQTAVPQIAFKTREEARSALTTFGTKAPTGDPIWLCTIGEYVQNKNLLTAIRAVEEVNAQHTQKLFYTLIGNSGDQENMLRTYVKDRALEEYVQIIGFVDNARDYLKAFDMFLLPSFKEGMPYGLLEAGAASLATVASNVGGIPEVIYDKKTGLLIDPKDISSIASALSYLLTHKEERNRLAHTLTEKVENEFALERMFEQTEAIYQN